MDLELRLKYLGLDTQIIQINSFEFVIYCEHHNGNFKEIRDYFNSSIRHIGTNVELVESFPQSYKQKIEGISFSNVVDGFKATCVTESDLFNFVESKFHNVDVIALEVLHQVVGFQIVITVSEETSLHIMDQMKCFLIDADLGTDKIIIRHVDLSVQTSNNKKDQESNSRIADVLRTFEVMNLRLYKQFPFTVNEADYWFEHAEDIYTGKIRRNDIPFFRQNSQKCFLNASVFETVNLRNVLLLYDTVYLGLPIENHLDTFLEYQNMKVSDLIELIDIGKVVIVLTNQETRYNQNLLLEAYQCSPLSVISRRGLNTILASHLVETKIQYEKRFPNIYQASCELFLQAKRENDNLLQRIAQMLAWPITAAASSFRFLHQNSPMSISNFGINLIAGGNFQASDLHEKLSFELKINADSTHLAAALQSTYFPFKHQTSGKVYSDQTVSNFMGDLLKMYWYDPASLEQIKQINDWNHSEQSYLKFFDTNRYLNVTKVASLADEYDTPNAFRNLLNRLEQMDSTTRRQTLNEYNDLLFEVSQTSGQSEGGFVKMMLSGAAFLPLNYYLTFALATIGLVHDKTSTLKSLQEDKKFAQIEQCLKNSAIQTSNQMKEDIFLLDKMSTVVTLIE
ncbi:hypothetical protein GCM10008014_00600 [Paenibacillus silvae]|uniref:Uncharacterized protein n=2 Tax=Paenibacillus silvae TaxID=1325358 RepID=A0ABQ1YY88_9BACL|nr:hypothetical protein GCM10008014_00600 [Paenibacillus silvae]